MKYTDKENQIGLAKQAARRWKANHVVYEYNKGLYRHKLDDGKTKGEVIDFKELEKQDKRAAKEVKIVSKEKDTKKIEQVKSEKD